MKHTLALAALALALPLTAQQNTSTITCNSNGGRQFCPANTVNGVRLVREQSNGVCQQGSTWSFNRRGITVNGGCSADFEVSSAGNANGGYNNGNNGYNNGQNNNGQNNNGNNQDNGYHNNGQTDNNGQGNNNGYGNNGSDNGYNNRNRGIVLPAGTQLSVRLDQNVRTSEAGQDESIAATLTNDVSVNGNVVAPAGTPVQAKISSTQGSNFDLRLTSMSVNGRSYRLSSNAVHSLRDAANNGDGNSNSAKQQLGQILGSVTSGGQIPSGTVFNFRLVSAAQPGGRGNGNNGNNDRQ